MAKNGLKIRRKQFHGGSIPPPGTIYPYYFQQFANDKAKRLDQVRYKIGYSAHVTYFQQFKDLCCSSLGSTLSIVRLVYAQLGSAQRIIGPPESAGAYPTAHSLLLSRLSNFWSYSIADSMTDQLRFETASSIESRITTCSSASLFRPAVMTSARIFVSSVSSFWSP
jgi:hypothetical protein